MKKTFIAILSVQFVLNVLFLVYAIMAKNEADLATFRAILYEKEAIKQAKISDLYKIQLDRTKSMSEEIQKIAKQQTSINLELQKQLIELKSKK